MSMVQIDRKRVLIDGTHFTVVAVYVVKGQLRTAYLQPSAGEKVETKLKFKGDEGNQFLENLVIGEDNTLINVWYRQGAAAPAALQARIGDSTPCVRVKGRDFHEAYAEMVERIAAHLELPAGHPLRDKMLATKEDFLKKNDLILTSVGYDQVWRKEK